MLQIDCLPADIQTEHDVQRYWRRESFQSFTFFSQQFVINVICFLVTTSPSVLSFIVITVKLLQVLLYVFLFLSSVTLEII